MIYENYFSLQQRPFSIAPNPQFLYAHGQYQEALAVLEYGMLHRGGFILLTGEVGTGKTTLCKHLLQSVPQNTEVALILHPQLDRIELLQLICREFTIEVNSQAKESELIASITEFLLQVYANGGYSLLVIDEAQHLDPQVLELIRLLTNLETHSDKLLQIILLGQPELRQRLERYELRQLNQRFTARFHLQPLNFPQIRSYVQHRLTVAGGQKHLFSWSALWMIKKLSGGIPRLINLLADRSLMGCYANNRQQVSAWMVYRSAKEVLPQPKSNRLKVSLVSMAFLAAVIIFVQNSKFVNFDSSNILSANNYSFKNVVNFSDEPKSSAAFLGECSLTTLCWQGQLPQSLLSYSLSPVSVYERGRWNDWSQPVSGKTMLLSRITLKAPFEWQSLIKPNETHSSILWVRGVLTAQYQQQAVNQDFSQWQMISPDGSNKPDAYYDVLLLERVKQFQRNHHLLVDGILGKQTLISLALWEQKNKEGQ